MKDKRSIITKYAIGSLIGLVIALTYFIACDIFNQKDATDVMKILSDGFAVGGILLSMAGLLTFCSAKGAFDGLGYSVETIFVSRNWSKRKIEERRTFSEYKEEKAKKRTTRWFLVIVGGIEFLISCVFLGLYYIV